MSEISREMNASTEMDMKIDLFQYYIRGIGELMSTDDFSPSSLTDSASVKVANGSCRKNEPERKETGCNEKTRPVGFSSLFCNAVGNGLAGHRKDRLVSMLCRSVVALSGEVDEMLDPVFGMLRLKSLLAPEKYAKTEFKEREGKRLKSCSDCSKQDTNESILGSSSKGNGEVNDALQVLLENRSPKIIGKLEKHSAEISAKLEGMKEKLEELLDVVVSSCREMTLAEKHQLWRLLQSLDPQNLDRVVEIIQRGKPPETQSGDDITVDLQNEDNSTLWRIYFHVKAAENAKKLL